MPRILSVLFFFLVVNCSLAQQVNIIPKPLSLKSSTGNYELTVATKIVSDHYGRKSAEFLQDYLAKYYGVRLKSANKVSERVIELRIDAQLASNQSHHYVLTINENGILIKANSPTGLFYGVQTFVQLLPVDGSEKLRVPFVEIEDHPAYGYRGLHLDVSRHFFPVSVIKRYLDLMAFHKLNYFHWHLTDNEGWRIEIKKYPKLTSVGAKLHTLAKQKKASFPGVYDGGNDGFYTRKDIRDIIRYAAARYITIIPEIDMPGHNMAALVAYPELSTQQLATGGKLTVAQNAIRPDAKSFDFMKNVLDEIILLFPGRYIHIGGDEVDFQQWEADFATVKLAKSKGFKNVKALENDFISSVTSYLNAKGRKAIGWDELLEGPIDSNVTIMCWRSQSAGTYGAQHGHDVIMSPYKSAYFDFAPHTNEDSITVKMYLPLSSVYNFQVVPANLSQAQAAHILGGQANLWTENIATVEKLQYMLLPRLSALSEALWTAPEEKDWQSFLTRLSVQKHRYVLWKVNYDKKAIE